jgi:16S rRNA (cytosine967-C5)-methyltransferase
MSGAAQSGLPARVAALALIEAVIVRRETLSDAIESPSLNGGHQHLTGRDRAFARSMAACVLRRKGQLDAITGHFLTRPLPAKAGRTRLILALGAAQILFLEIPHHAAVNLSVKLADGDRNARHFKGLINAVLRKVAGDSPQLLDKFGDIVVNTPSWLMQRWRKTYGADAAAALALQHTRKPPLDITPKANARQWAEKLGGKLLATGSIRLNGAGQIPELAGYDEGAWWVQDTAATLPARLLGDVAGKTVVDLCAAPGGKTAQLANAGARVIAVDRSAARLKILKANLTRLKLDAELVRADATSYRPDERIDAVLLDAPCSATGIIRRNPDVAHLKSRSGLLALVGAQRQLLDNAMEIVEPGGFVVYCTCSLEPEECSDQIERLIAANRARRVPITAYDLFGLDHLATPAGDLRSLPHHNPGDAPETDGMDGFYAARLAYT